MSFSRYLHKLIEQYNGDWEAIFNELNINIPDDSDGKFSFIFTPEKK